MTNIGGLTKEYDERATSFTCKDVTLFLANFSTRNTGAYKTKSFMRDEVLLDHKLIIRKRQKYITDDDIYCISTAR